ncbi:hypothetical protein TanjilG_18169 [Lupinus angustifolius]|uniref:Beta-1,3-N-Acetylglucosaminyltransferase family protein n=1 Tax=Lupinus angustifolius TaxID=3871 RepID=A0A1J7FNL7_LUPAN|nr:PREDICTED: uncharacterized protein LOC109340982 [Lupinus angustifolius]OIV89587.1 hypothetical protein TanjilG_18169 [Lupinus angustifolius]
MAATNEILTILLFLCLISQGYGFCSIKDLTVDVAKSGAEIKGKPEWVVTITNKCACVQKDVKLNCKGFNTVEQIDPSILSVSDNVCLVVNNGNPIYRDPITFKYAWDTQFPLNPIESQIACS